MKDTKIKTFIIAVLISLSVFTFAQNKTTPIHKEIKVYVFLSESCPICQSYTLTLKKLYEKYKSQHIIFIAVFPNYYSTLDSINAFQKKYNLPFQMVLDQTGTLTKKFQATITPEVIVQNEKQEVVYRGRIDDSFYKLGKRRNVITSNDLDDALQAIVTNQKIKTPETQAVGCIIDASK